MKKLFLSAVGLMTILSGFAGAANAWVVVHRVRIVYHRPIYRPMVRLQAPILVRPVGGPDGGPGPQIVYADGGGETQVVGGANQVAGSNGPGDEGGGSRHRESRAEDGSGGEHWGHDGGGEDRGHDRGGEHRERNGGSEGHHEPHSLGRFEGEGPHGRTGGMHATRSFGGRHGRR